MTSEEELKKEGYFKCPNCNLIWKIDNNKTKEQIEYENGEVEDYR